MRKLPVLLFVATLSMPCGFAQKVKSGYDKSVDFSRYKTYTLQEPAITPSRPLLYASVMGSIKNELDAKGLTGVAKDGDLTVLANGVVGYESASPLAAPSCANCKAPLVDAADWTGKMAPPGSSNAPLPKGILELDFVDRESNKIVWSGRVMEKLDPEKKTKTLQKVGPAIQKLLAEFPPQKGK